MLFWLVIHLHIMLYVAEALWSKMNKRIAMKKVTFLIGDIFHFLLAETGIWFSFKLHFLDCWTGWFKYWFNCSKSWICSREWQEKPPYGPSSCTEGEWSTWQGTIYLLTIQGSSVPTSNYLIMLAFKSLFQDLLPIVLFTHVPTCQCVIC